MSIQERLTKNLAVRISRRGFIKGLGKSILVLGVALIGNIVNAEAGPACCPNPECSGCQSGGSNCPSGYTKMSWSTCCVHNYQYTCATCKCWSSGPNCQYPGYTCYCTHDDLICCDGNRPPCAIMQNP
jgi:hypothetical protein